MAKICILAMMKLEQGLCLGKIEQSAGFGGVYLLTTLPVQGLSTNIDALCCDCGRQRRAKREMGMNTDSKACSTAKIGKRKSPNHQITAKP